MHIRERNKDPHVIVSNYRAHVLIYNKENLPTGNCLKSKQYTGLMNSTCIITWKKGTTVKEGEIFFLSDGLESHFHTV